MKHFIILHSPVFRLKFTLLFSIFCSACLLFSNGFASEGSSVRFKVVGDNIVPHMPSVVKVGQINTNSWKHIADTSASSEKSNRLTHQAEESDTSFLWGFLGFMFAVASAVSLISIAFFIINSHLKNRIAEKTKELQTKNEQLHNEIYHRKQTERELQENSDELEHIVSLRTRELHIEVKEHQHALCLLRQSEGKLRSVLSSMNDTVYLIDQRKKVIFFQSPNQTKTLINMQGEVLGQSLDSLIPKSILSEFDKAIEENKQGNIVEIDCFQDQSQRWFAVKLSPVFEDHYYCGSLAVSREISNRKSYEVELKQATLEAEKANQVKGEFLAVMSHELRTPLNAVIGLYFLLMRTKLDSNQTEYVQQIYSSSQSLCYIIDDILDFSKAEAGTLKFEAVDFKLVKLAQQLQANFTSEIDDKNITLNIDIDEDIPNQLNGFELRLAQVLNNLLSNAIKFSNDNGLIELYIKTESATDSQHTLNFKIIDNGVGILEEDISRLFKPFSQIDNKLSRNYTGTGLGLSIAQNLVHVMGGEITCQSAINKGSTFRFSIPLDHAKKDLIEERVDPDDKVKLAHVLIVDDDELNRLISSELISPYVKKVTIAESGKEAVALCQTETFSIVLMDVQMPNMDGYQATQQILKNKDLIQLPIIAMTAHASQEAHDKSISAGMSDHITKPLNPELLLETLRKWI